jgi:hypothetical protein
MRSLFTATRDAIRLPSMGKGDGFVPAGLKRGHRKARPLAPRTG